MMSDFKFILLDCLLSMAMIYLGSLNTTVLT